MGERVQRRIAEEAVERGYIASNRASEILIEVGQRLVLDDSVSPDIWVEEGWLTSKQLETILEDLPLDDGASWFDTFHGVEQPDDGFDRESTQIRDESTDAWASSERKTDPTGKTAIPTADVDSDDESRAGAPVREPRANGPGGSERSGEGGSSDETGDASGSDPAPGETGSEPPPDSGSKPFDSSSQKSTDVVAADETDSDPQKTTIDSSASDLDPPAPSSSEPRDDLADSSPGRSIQPKSSSDAFTPEVAALEAASQEGRLDPGERYVVGEELGRGGSGRVVRAQDRVLGRSVAMKLVGNGKELDSESLSRFVEEARATGRLEHPNIVPIYDFGVLPDGNVFYTMREVGGESLRDVIRRMRSGDTDYTLVRLVNFLRQVSQAVHYAHDHSVVHRDLKPDNVMLGEFGEVLVMDWGLARVLEDHDPPPDHETRPSGVGGQNTLGTPSYMPPEQARGDLEAVDETSDVYSLGATLYEILTLSPPYSGGGALDVMWDVVDAPLTPPSERAPEDREVPDELEQICLKAMDSRREERHDSARAFHEDLEAWLEGLQPRQSQRLVRAGETASARYYELLDKIEDQKKQVREMSSNFEGWEPIENKRELWDLEDELERLEAEGARAFCEAVSKYTQALAKNPENEDANQGLADLYWTRLRRAEMRQDHHDIIYFETLVEQYDPGKYEDLLESRSDLFVDTEPQGAEIRLFEYEERERCLEPTSPKSLGKTPTEAPSIETGSYLVKVIPDDRRKIQQPVLVERDRDAEVALALPPPDAFEEGFRYIPGGEYLSGGDPEAFDPRPPERVHVDPFFCSTFPVTFKDYLLWINELYDEIGEEALERAPQTRGAEGLLITRDEDEERWVPDPILIEGDARERYPADSGAEWQLPVIGVRAADAEAYCRWRSERDGRNYRLPKVHEYEKAARGVDGRWFPWGNEFDPTFCKMRFSRPENPPQPEPVGVFKTDRSPYGVRDMAGGVQEWCYHEDDGESRRPTKGGGWGQDARLCHLASTVDIMDEARNARIGFRLAYEPDW